MEMTWYDRVIKMAQEAEERKKKGRVITRAREMKFEDTRQARIALLHHPQIMGSGAQTMLMFVAELPPGSNSGCHRHMNEAMVYILRGKGYSVIDGERHDWETGDAIAVPTYAWHQHFNTDKTQVARYLAVTNDPLMTSMGLLRLEHQEYCPEFKGE